MINTRLLLLDGTLLTLIFSAFVGFTIWWKPRMWLHDFPQDIQDRVPPKTAAEKRLTNLVSIPFSILLFGGLGLTAFRFGLDNGLLATMFHVYLVWQVVNVFDLIVIDWGGMYLIDPQNPPFPGTEGAKGYRDYKFHLLGFLKGSVIGLVLAPVIVGILWVLVR
ncbi:MAG: hypothetical protein CSA11_09165 [Chloroflexi bacterium]|nr:MAG: hypothetical protein CSA11_09165 [Chloroflexota bacterium]